MMSEQNFEEWAKPCLCTFSQKVQGDGCYICNPERAKELSEEGDEDE